MLKTYIGTCFVCFGLVEKGKGYHLRKGGRLFHEQCVEENPKDYYVLLERKCLEEQ